jgi:hypothetical protein
MNSRQNIIPEAVMRYFMAIGDFRKNIRGAGVLVRSFKAGNSTCTWGTLISKDMKKPRSGSVRARTY